MSRFKPGQQIVCIKPEGEKWTADDGSGVIGYGPKFNELVNVDYYKDNHITLIQYPQIIDGFRHAFNENEFEPLPEINELTYILESETTNSKRMNPLTYTIVRGQRDYPEQFQEVKGFVMFDLFGYQWATHQDIPAGNWIVSEVSTGFELESGKFFEDKEEASYWAWAYLLKKGEGLTRFHVEKCRMKIQEYETIRNNATAPIQGQ